MSAHGHSHCLVMQDCASSTDSLIANDCNLEDYDNAAFKDDYNDESVNSDAPNGMERQWEPSKQQVEGESLIVMTENLYSSLSNSSETNNSFINIYQPSSDSNK